MPCARMYVFSVLEGVNGITTGFSIDETAFLLDTREHQVHQPFWNTAGALHNTNGITLNLTSPSLVQNVVSLPIFLFYYNFYLPKAACEIESGKPLRSTQCFQSIVHSPTWERVGIFPCMWQNLTCDNRCRTAEKYPSSGLGLLEMPTGLTMVRWYPSRAYLQSSSLLALSKMLPDWLTSTWNALQHLCDPCTSLLFSANTSANSISNSNKQFFSSDVKSLALLSAISCCSKLRLHGETSSPPPALLSSDTGATINSSSGHICSLVDVDVALCWYGVDNKYGYLPTLQWGLKCQGLH